MTGFGRGKYENEGRIYTVEIKSVNHKYADISIRMPRFLNSVEDKIRKRICEYISRGKIDVFISFENYSNTGVSIKINKELAKEYINQLKELADETDVKFDLNVIDISKLPEILKLENGEDANLPVGNSIKGTMFKNIRSGIVCEIKGGSLFGETLLANTGPSIPIRLSFIGEVLTSIRTNIKSYGLNNAYLEVDVEVKITERITMPISTKDVTIKKNIPIAMKVIQGRVPSYYNENIERLSESYSLPLTE